MIVLFTSCVHMMEAMTWILFSPLEIENMQYLKLEQSKHISQKETEESSIVW
jgi:hypothetical protein